jgi:hypothetical protein
MVRVPNCHQLELGLHPGCRHKAHSTGKAQFLPKAADVDERGAVWKSKLIRSSISTGGCAESILPLGKRPSAVALMLYSRLSMASVRPANCWLAGVGRTETLVYLEAGRATLAAKGRQIEVEAAPIRHLAEPVGGEIDSERTIR